MIKKHIHPHPHPHPHNNKLTSKPNRKSKLTNNTHQKHSNSNNAIICDSNLITRKAHIRKAYNRKNGSHINQSFIRKSCIKKYIKKHVQSLIDNNITHTKNKTNNTTKTKNKIVLDADDHYLNKYGYYEIENKTIDDRQESLHKVINHFIPIKGLHNTYKYVIKALYARYILQLATSKKIAKLFKQDMTYIKKEYNTKKHDII